MYRTKTVKPIRHRTVTDPKLVEIKSDTTQRIKGLRAGVAGLDETQQKEREKQFKFFNFI